jgi:hypothetical protein
MLIGIQVKRSKVQVTGLEHNICIHMISRKCFMMSQIGMVVKGNYCDERKAPLVLKLTGQDQRQRDF